MENFIKYLEVRNFKSLKDLKIECSKINLFIGRTNVGKSNLLEALSLLGKSSGERFYSDMIKYKDIDNLFYFRDISEPITITTDKHKAIIKKWQDNNFLFLQNLVNNKINIKSHFHQNPNNVISNFLNFMRKEFSDYTNRYSGGIINVANKRLQQKNHIDSDIKYYKFKLNDFNVDDIGSLNDPHGNNLFRVFSTNRNLTKQLTAYLADYNLDLLFQPIDNIFKIQKREDMLVYDIPFILLADTLLRIMFYKAAILSNEDSVLIFEEPEVNSYPPYIRDLTDEILEDKNNQFFISTHSPYIFEKIIQENRDDISIFVLDYKDHETVAYKISDEQIMKILDYDMDVFLNMDKIIYE